MEIYLAIIWTYLSISFTLFFITLHKQKDNNKEIDKDNQKYREEIKSELKEIKDKFNELIFKLNKDFYFTNKDIWQKKK